MFINNGKCRCCNGIWTDILFTLLLAKNIEVNDILFLNARITIYSAILSEIFIQIG